MRTHYTISIKMKGEILRADYNNIQKAIEFCGSAGEWVKMEFHESFSIHDGYNADIVNNGDWILKIDLPWGAYFRVLTEEEFDVWKAYQELQ